MFFQGNDNLSSSVKSRVKQKLIPHCQKFNPDIYHRDLRLIFKDEYTKDKCIHFEKKGVNILRIEIIFF